MSYFLLLSYSNQTWSSNYYEEYLLLGFISNPCFKKSVNYGFYLNISAEKSIYKS